MRSKTSLLICLFLISGISFSQKIDSVRQVIKAMGYDLPRLSPVPESVKESGSSVISLNGTWKFSVDSRQKIAPRNIEVPGEWVMQGFSVKPGVYAEYQRDFSIPSDFRGKRIKLRCDAVYSECEIFVNGKKAGGHLGGFTAFETDITALVRSGKENNLSIRVRNESIADTLASGSQYAVHPLGGINRKIFLLALPEMNCSMFHVSTAFDKNYLDAKLITEIELSNESTGDANTTLRFELSRDGDPVKVFTKDVKIEGAIKANTSVIKTLSFDVKNPMKWDPEHPHLYSLRLSVISDGKVVEGVERKFGFRQIEVRGNQVFVNNMAVKLRGVCRHEVMPLRGRSLSPGQWEEDVKLFKGVNINYIRTSHYPPAPELLEACDRLGMFVEVEGPFCWAGLSWGHFISGKLNEVYYQALVQPELEMINTFRSNPSVLIWSIANESGNYKEYFSQAAALIKAIDPTRPRNFSYQPDEFKEDIEIGNQHYPGPKGPEKYANSKIPVLFDEYCHLNAYNRFELVTDPGVRDVWGIGFERMWDKMYHAQGVLGGAIWAAIDDSFIFPDGRAVGYGTWGPVDGWRRPKPEYWHVKKVYSPVKIKQTGKQDAAKGIVEFEIENRTFFTNLSECSFNWKSGVQTGSFNVKARPGETTLVVANIQFHDKIFVEVKDPSGLVIDQYEFTLIPQMADVIKRSNVKTTLTENNSETRITSGNITLVIDRNNHSLKEILSDGKTMIEGDARLMVLPLNGEGNGTQMKGDTARFDPFTATCNNRVAERIEQTSDEQGYRLRIFDRSDEATGYTEYLLSNGELNVNYKYEIRLNINPRQTGLVFTLPNRFQKLDWERSGQWNFYPDDHIGRLKGSAVAINSNPFSGPVGPVAKPALAWAFDQNELGTNDFRSTKINILKASLSDSPEKVNVVSDGTQSLRCWLACGKTNMLVASYSNMGAERFFRGHAELSDRPLKPGDIISGSVKLTFSK